MSCCCYIIPKHIEDKVNSRCSEPTSRVSEISTEMRCHRKTQKHLREIKEKGLASITTKNQVYTAKNRRNLPGTLLSASMSEASSSKDINVVCAWLYSDYFARFCRDILGRESFDGKNGMIKSTVHYYVKYNNAFFNGTQMIYGDGDHITFEDFSQDPSVVFHELWHGITDITCGLEYRDQSGALNESLSDVFANIILQWMNGETVDEASWLIGDRCVIDIDNVHYALRSMADPGMAYIDHPYMGTDEQPSNMSQYYSGNDDNGGVHINSGIPNHAFYLFAKSVGGYSWNVPCKIWYKTITTPGLVSPGTTFSEFAQATITVATELYGSNNIEIVDKLRSAWQSVKII
jgi:Zn-dependent metalloprotease